MIGGARELVRQAAIQYGVSEQAAEELVAQATRSAAEKKRRQDEIEAARSLSYRDWLRTETSDPEMNWDYAWIEYVVPYIQAIIDGSIVRLILNIPPRVGKSNLVTVRLPVYWLERNPRDRVILGAYGGGLATSFAQQSMSIYKLRHPNGVYSEAKDRWINVYGGFEYPVGVGSGVTGYGAELLLIDDPVKSFAESISPAYMNETWNWFLKDLISRRNDKVKTPVLIIHTRWNDDDLTGRIMNSRQARRWTLVTVPAMAESQEDRDDYARHMNLPVGLPDPLGRQIGESILPDRLPASELLEEQIADEQGFAALYQQKPIQISSASFKVQNLKMVDEVPFDADRVRYWDTAGTPGGGDWTVGVLMAHDDNGAVYIEDVVRGQWAEEDVDKIMRQTAILDNMKYGCLRTQISGVLADALVRLSQDDPGKFSEAVQKYLAENQRFQPTLRLMQTWVEREPAASGKKVSTYRVQNVLVGLDAHEEPARDAKGVRAKPFVAAVNTGTVRLLKAPWNAEYIAEMRVYVIGMNNRRDDQIDPSSGAYFKLAIERLVVSIR
jgi:hypothetical protein